MKRITKIFAILLSVCLMSGLFAIFSSAKAPESTTDLGYANNHEGLSSGSSPSYDISSVGSQAATTAKVVSNYGNKYLQLLYVKDSAHEKNTRKDFKFGIFSGSNKAPDVAAKL